MVFYFEDTKVHFMKTEEDDEHCRNKNICRFCVEETIVDKLRDRCHLTRKYRGPAQCKM